MYTYVPTYARVHEPFSTRFLGHSSYWWKPIVGVVGKDGKGATAVQKAGASAVGAPAKEEGVETSPGGAGSAGVTAAAVAGGAAVVATAAVRVLPANSCRSCCCIRSCSHLTRWRRQAGSPWSPPRPSGRRRAR